MLYAYIGIETYKANLTKEEKNKLFNENSHILFLVQDADNEQPNTFNLNYEKLEKFKEFSGDAFNAIMDIVIDIGAMLESGDYTKVSIPVDKNIIELSTFGKEMNIFVMNTLSSQIYSLSNFYIKVKFNPIFDVNLKIIDFSIKPLVKRTISEDKNAFFSRFDVNYKYYGFSFNKCVNELSINKNSLMRKYDGCIMSRDLIQSSKNLLKEIENNF